jgi:hypothetical protein
VSSRRPSGTCLNASDRILTGHLLGAEGASVDAEITTAISLRCCPNNRKFKQIMKTLQRPKG